MKLFGFSWGLFMLITAFLYGSSLRYSFVYDDDFRIVHNPGIHSNVSLKKIFTDPDLQSNWPQLNRHTYRPLWIWQLREIFVLWGYRPAPYRLINLIVH